jgi:hypothetical protein
MKLALLALLAGCNWLYGLDDTELLPPEQLPPDRDHDEFADDEDNCPATANDQTDEDLDGFGDACDFCLMQKTAFNTDEDGDLFGDDCDICPAMPDFQLDSDGDGVGNECSLGTPTRAVLFDGFRTLDGAWVSAVEWKHANSAINPVVVDDTTGLQNHTVRVDGRIWSMKIEVRAQRAWKAGDRFGLGLVAPDGTLLLRGRVSCDATCKIILEKDGQVIDSGDVVKSDPIVRMSLDQIVTSTSPLLRVVLGNISSASAAVPVGVAGAPVLYSSPDIQVSYVTVYAGD